VRKSAEFVACASDHAAVAQISNLLYRSASSLQSMTRLTSWELGTLCRLEIGDTADWKSALHQRHDVSLT